MKDKSLLIAVRDPAVVRLVHSAAPRLGVTVIAEAATAQEAIDTVQRNRPELVLLSLGLGGEPDGAAAGRTITEDFQVPVVYLASDAAATTTIDWNTLHRPFGLITHPIDELAMEAAIRVAVDRIDLEAGDRTDADFLSTVFHAFPSPVMVVEADGMVTMCNQKALGTFQLECDGRPKPIGEIIRCTKAEIDNPFPCTVPCDRCDLVEIIQKATQGEPIENRRCVIGVENGRAVERVVLDVSASPFQHNGRKRAVVILEDRTEVDRLRKLVSGEHVFSGIVGRTPEMRQVFSTIREVAEVGLPVLVHGETGTGKELVARAIHDCGPRRQGAFVAVNCGAIPEGLLESDLFGHVKGAFTGAMRDRQGRFTLAKGGTIFLDEVGDLSPTVQVKLLRVLQEQTYEPVGSERTLTADVRVISATNKDLRREVESGRFRKDLYYRLCVLPIDLPPLRQRSSDIPLIAAHLLARNGTAEKTGTARLSREAIALFLDHCWSGNVRELDNVLQYARMKCRGDEILPEHLPPSFRVEPEPPAPTAAARTRAPLDRDSVADAIARAGGNRTRAAELLGVSRATLYRFLSRNPV
jgi:DNA-binding NtrC family response regulator